MAGNGRGGTSSTGRRRWLAAILVFLVGVILLLLAVFGPVFWGVAFDAAALKTPAWGLIVVSVYVMLGVSIPALLGGRAPEGDKGSKDGGDGNDAG